MTLNNFVYISLLFLQFHVVSNTKFEPNWKSLDSRKVPDWYDKAKVGIFIHWGVYAVPSFGGFGTYLAEWFWNAWKTQKKPEFVKFMKENYPPGFEYQDFTSLWRAEFFNATKWADLIEASGAKYFVITSKHHDGFTLWQSNVSWNWNAVDVGPHRDLIAELAEKIGEKKDIKFGLYYSLYEWYNRIYLKDKSSHFTGQNYVDEIMLPQLRDIVNRYHPEYIWSDGDWETGFKYFKSEEFLAWLYNDSPVKDTVVVNDRWGIGTACKHGDIKTCGIDRFNPHKRQQFKWENAMTIDRHSWGFRRDAHLSDYLTMYNLTEILAETISLGGNLIMNIGPTADGRIAPIFQERLQQMGGWLRTNGEGIYATTPWRVQNDTKARRLWFTQKPGAVYAITLDWPNSGFLNIYHPVPSSETTVTLLGYDGQLPWNWLHVQGLVVDVRSVPYNRNPSKWAWVFKLTGVE